jgi:O-antigen/teichoic acid export membrane protein
MPTLSAGADLFGTSMSLARDIFRQTTTTAATTLMVQLSTFAILAAAPLLLPSEAFAELSVIVASTMLANAFFDFGLSLTTTKFYGANRDGTYFFAAFRIRLLCLPLAAVALVLLAELTSLGTVGFGILNGAFLNLWNGVRATDQARQDYRSFTRISMIFASLRLVCGASALIALRDPVAIGLGLFVLPTVALFKSSSWQYVAGAIRNGGQGLARMLRYTFYVYINALVFIGIPYISQFVVAGRFDAVATGTYGLVITFTAPVSLVIYSLRAVMLPKMLGRNLGVEDVIWSGRGARGIAVIALLLCLGGVIIGLGLEQVYGSQFPEIRHSFTVFFFGFSVTAAVGIYSLSVHTLGLPQVAMWVAFGKAVAMAALLTLFGATLGEVIAITSFVMVLGELVLVALLFHAKVKRNS